MSYFYILVLSLFFILWFFVYLSVYSYNRLRLFTYFFLLLFFLMTLSLLILYDKSITWYIGRLEIFKWSFYGISYYLGLDSISIFLMVLSAFLLVFCFLIYWFLRYKINLYASMMLLTLWILLNVFSCIDLFIFYIFFEAVIIPMFIIIVYEVVVVEKFMLRINF